MHNQPSDQVPIANVQTHHIQDQNTNKYQATALRSHQVCIRLLKMRFKLGHAARNLPMLNGDI